MDSANSGSIQSSSGADEEYDSRADSSSFFLNNNPTPQPHPLQNIFHLDNNTFSNFLDPRANLDMVWSKSIRSEPNQPDLTSFVNSSSSTQSNQAFLFGHHAFPTTPHESVPRAAAAAAGGGQLLSVTTVNNDVSVNHTHNTTTTPTNNNTVRNPKKRSRASRRAPTTVLTTDTTNFRAMVQEFTGIPAPPFPSSSPFSRPRLDLFGSVSTIRSSPLEPPPYLLRPFAQKLDDTTFPNSSSELAPVSNNSSTTNSTSINYPLNIQNPILNFQSILPNSVQQSSLEIPPTVGLLDVNNNNNNNGLLHHNDVVPSYRSKVNYAAPPPQDFHGEKAPECAVEARSEGMLESWINCSSD